MTFESRSNPINVLLTIFWLKNVFPKKWKQLFNDFFHCHLVPDIKMITLQTTIYFVVIMLDKKREESSFTTYNISPHICTVKHWLTHSHTCYIPRRVKVVITDLITSTRNVDLSQHFSTFRAMSRGQHRLRAP